MRNTLARHRGTLSLLLASGGWIGILVVGKFTEQPGTALILLRHVFEGAMVGGVADWFAVRALFRRIPIPLLQRHTNIISKNRPRLVEGIVDMVQNQWLAPAVIRERLQQVSLSRMGVHYLQQPAVRLQALGYLRTLLSHGAALLDNPILARFATDLAARHLNALDLNALLLRPLRSSLQDDSVFDQLWSNFSVTLQRMLLHDDVRELIYAGVENLIAQYLHDAENKGVLVGTWARIKLWVGMPGRDERRVWLYDKLDMVAAHLAEQGPGGASEVRHTVRDKLLHLLQGLEDSNSPAMQMLLEQQGKLVQRLCESDLVQQLLSSAADSCTRQLAIAESPLSTWLADLYDDALSTTGQDTRLQARIDRTVGELLVNLVEQNPDLIGATVRHALSPQRLSDAALIAQIEDKVGDDLQWIRVNGAVVGGLVAGVLAAVQLWL